METWYKLPEQTATLRPGLGVEVAQGHCAACHSVDYVNIQPSAKGQIFWDALVQKMVKAFHAPIDEANARTIGAYLGKTY